MSNSTRSIFALCTAIASFTIAGPSTAEVPHLKIGRFAQEVATAFTVADGLPSNDVQGVYLDKSGTVWAKTDQGWAVRQGNTWTKADAPAIKELRGYVDPQEYAAIDRNVTQVARTADSKIVAATDQGLLIQSADRFEPLIVQDGLGRRWGTSDVRGVAFDSHGQLWFATLAGAACQRSRRAGKARGWILRQRQSSPRREPPLQPLERQSLASRLPR